MSLTNQYVTPFRRKIEARRRKAVDLVLAGKTDVAIAKELKEHLTQVQDWRKEAGLKHNYLPADTGHEGEKLVLEKCLENGLASRLMPFGSPFDVLAGGLRIEVKTAKAIQTRKHSPHRSDGGYEFLNFDIASVRGSLYGHSYEKDYADSCDFLVAVWLTEAPKFWVIPKAKLPKELIQIQLTGYPASSRKYAKYENRFDLLGAAA